MSLQHIVILCVYLIWSTSKNWSIVDHFLFGNLLLTTLQAEHWGQKDAKVPQCIKHLRSALKGVEQHLQCTAGTFRGKRKK